MVRPIARNFNWVVLLYKIVDLFSKILDLLFERGVLPHLENPLAMGLMMLVLSPTYSPLLEKLSRYC